MNILDHRILIPKSSKLVWEVVSDFSQNPTWQVDHTSISFLTSRREGVGVRWRYSIPNGREYVAETVAWYDGLGYEYTFIDGIPYRENKGRIRLQEIAEGTVVQWTFSYQMGGLLGGVRNAIVVKRQIENVMVESLKTLWRILNQSGVERDLEVKSLMRDAPDFEARAQYKPRHPSAAKAAQEQQADAQAAPVAIPEPDYSDEDTRPRPPIQAEAPANPVEVVEPELEVPEAETPEKVLAAAGDVTTSTTVSETVEAEASIEADEQIVYSQPPESVHELPRDHADNDLPELVTPPNVFPDKPVITDIPSTDETEERQEHADVTETQEQVFITQDAMDKVSSTTTAEAVIPNEESPGVIGRSSTETAEISVFDVFGVPKPSQTQEMAAVSVPESVIEMSSVPRMRIYTGRIGLRLTMRRKRVKVRRPE